MTAVAERKAPRRSRRVILTLALAALFTVGIAVLMLALAGTFERKVKVGTSRGVVPRPAVTPERAVGVVKLIRQPRQESAVGTIRAVHEAVVASKILARVEEVCVKAGQQVKQGDVLVVLDKADLRSRLEQALAAERAAKAKYDQTEIDLGRAGRLRARESVTQSELDQASTAMRTAQAELERARRAVEEGRIVESYATVRAPISGRVIDKKVNAGDTVSPGQMLVTMYDPSHMQLIATVRESLALRLKVGQQVPARLDTLGYVCRATISEIVPEAQAESRSFQVKVTGPCPPNIYSGMFGRIFIPLEDEDVLVVPPEAVRRVGQLDEVDVVAEGAVSRRAVQLGRTLDEGREVLSGLTEGEAVVLAGGAAARSEGGQP
ncbi:MAG: efflux RND transporter periplasmic adaptor subunit [Isosphaeraceae bacterium]|nr:efflux RND transporter periplasmic adaptor subunit [Isosphaeraceae bacterium]